jgi:hypothetical protein
MTRSGHRFEGDAGTDAGESSGLAAKLMFRRVGGAVFGSAAKDMGEATSAGIGAGAESGTSFCPSMSQTL